MIGPYIEYKYRIKEKLESLSHDEYKLAMTAFPKILKISKRTFHRYIYTRVNEEYSMPVDDLARLADFFKCRMEDLLNYQPTPLFSKGMNKSKNELASRIGLVR